MAQRDSILGKQIHDALESVPELEDLGRQVKQTLHQAVLDGGPEVRNAVDMLHGTWLGHPLHPVLTDVTIGAWGMAALFDVLSMLGGGRASERAADTMLDIGTASAAATAITGLADYSTIPNNAIREGAAHGLLNITGFILNLISSGARKSGMRGLGVLLSSISFGILMISAWLGGELVYRKRVGINHNSRIRQPENWTTVIADADLQPLQPRRVEVAGEPVLLYRKGNDIFAIGAVCSHAGGPLDEGHFYDNCVQCPWHDSVFNLRDGSVVHGPSTFSQPLYEARVYNGDIQVRLVHDNH